VYTNLNDCQGHQGHQDLRDLQVVDRREARRDCRDLPIVGHQGIHRDRLVGNRREVHADRLMVNRLEVHRKVLAADHPGGVSTMDQATGTNEGLPTASVVRA